MTLLDANILLYAYNADAAEQAPAARWLQDLLTSGESIGLPWVSLWAFLRIATNHRIWPNPLPARSALEVVGEWLSQPAVVAVEPGPRHAEILERLILANGASGTLVSDAALAALAIENGATLASTDQDFRRFPDLKWVNPLASFPR